MAHGHSHGGGGKKSKDEHNHKRDEDALEMADRELLCADERIAVERNNHGHSHAAESTNDGMTNGESESKKKGCTKRIINLLNEGKSNL